MRNISDPAHIVHRRMANMSGAAGSSNNLIPGGGGQNLGAISGTDRVADYLLSGDTQDPKRPRVDTKFEDLSKTELVALMKTMAKSMDTMLELANAVAAKPDSPAEAGASQSSVVPKGSGGSDLKINPEVWADIEKIAGETQKASLRLIKTRRRVAKHEKELANLRLGTLPDNVRVFNAPFESEHLDSIYAEEDITCSYTIPRGSSYRDAMRISHLAFNTQIKSIELKHQQIIAAAIQPVSTFESFKQRVEAIEFNRSSNEVEGLEPKYSSDPSLVNSKCKALWQTKLAQIDSALLDEKKQAEKKQKADKANLDKVESKKPTSALKDFILGVVNEADSSLAHTSAVMDLDGECEESRAIRTLNSSLRKSDEEKRAKKAQLEIESKLVQSLKGGKGKDKGKGGNVLTDNLSKGSSKGKGKTPSKGKGKGSPKGKGKGKSSGKGKDKGSGKAKN